MTPEEYEKFLEWARTLQAPEGMSPFHAIEEAEAIIEKRKLERERRLTLQ